MTPRVELENKVGIVNQATMDYNITLQGRLRCKQGKHCVQLSVVCQITVSIYIYIYIFVNRTDHTVNEVGTVGSIAEANMRDFDRKKQQQKETKKKKKKRAKQEHMETAAN